MLFKTPSFWYREPGSQPGALESSLAPLSAIYRIGYEIHQVRGRQQKFDIPIICVGNLNAGGTGKTPAVIALMRTIKNHGLAAMPFFMSRGYGGGELGPLLVDAAKHTAWHTGDEPLILAAHAPTIVSHRRPDGILMAMHRRADMVLMDDGLQNPGIFKNIKIMVINGDMGFGNMKTLPAGPLREPLERGLERADAFVLIGEDRRGVRSLLPAGKPVFTSALASGNQPSRDKKYLAFAGIGYPEKFFRFLKDSANLDLAGMIRFPDHYPYDDEDMQDLAAKAAAHGATLITTEKDYMRIPKSAADAIEILTIRLEWDDEPALAQFLKSMLETAHG